jgi:hypothetical protein
MVQELLRRHPTLRKKLREPAGHEAVDFVSSDGAWGIELAESLRGVRDLSAHALMLARWVVDHPSKQAALVIVSPRMTPQMEAEWTAILKVLRKDVAQRITLVTPERAPTRPASWMEPLLEALRRPDAESASARPEPPAAPTAKLFDVVKLLLHRWIRKEGPIRVLALADQAGCSYPTVFKAIARLERYGELSRTSRRSVMLKEFPTKTWGELLALLPTLRQTATFLDASGRRFDPAWLLSRLKQQLPARVAISGVQAARHWHPEFNLNGVPRIDLVMHAPDEGSYDLAFVSKLDPALKRTPSSDPRHQHEVVLAIHRLSRRAPLFEPDPKKGIPFADPVEAVLDLHDLRLASQAEELIQHLAGSGRGA